MSTERPIAFDPFFDGDGSQVRRPVGPPMPGTQNYRDPGTELLEGGRTMAERMPAGPRGLRGTVIPHATQGGIVRGLEPHNVRNMDVVIDPHIEGQSTVLHLGNITPEAMQRAVTLAAQNTPEPDSIQTQRLRGSAVMHSVALATSGGQRANGHAVAASPATIQAPNLGRMGQPAQRIVRPLQAFTHAPQANYEPDGPRELRAIDLGGAPARAPVVQAPTVEVVFEIERFGTHTAVYHDVIVEPGFIILIYKSDYRGSKYFPEARAGDAPPLAMNVVGRPEAYLVHTTGVRYVYEGAEHCVLLVERAGSLAQVAPTDEQEVQ